MSDFSKARVGDKVYSLLNGLGTVVSVNGGVKYPIQVEFVSVTHAYTFDGLLTKDHVTPDLYWSKPEIIEPPAPKRMKTVETERWFLVGANPHFSEGVRWTQCMCKPRLEDIPLGFKCIGPIVAEIEVPDED